MARDLAGSHAEFAAALRSRVQRAGVLDRELRDGLLARGAGGPALAEPYETLAGHVSEDSFRVSDVQVASVREAVGSEKAAFEVVLTAAIGAGLRRWDAANAAIKAAGDAPF